MTVLNKSSLKLNVLANFSGRIWITLIGILVVPLYLRYLGVELYGIIGVFASLQAVLTLLDVGLSPTLNREMARLSAFPDSAQEMRNLTRSLEIPFWLISIFIGLLTFVISPYIAQYWIKSETISVETVSQSLQLMSIGFAFQWAGNLYSGGLMGLQRQVAYNFINAFCQTVRTVGSVITLVYISSTIQAFLLWQTIWSIGTTFIFVIAFWRSLPKADSPSEFRIDLLRNIWRFAAGMTGISFVTLVLTQLDKIILSKMLTLELFGYYSLANMLTATALAMIVGSVSSAYYPQFSQIAALGDIEKLKDVYHKSCQVMSFLLIPVTAVIAFFSYPILVLWTKDVLVAENTYLLLTLLAIGTGLNGLVFLPYYMQLANGLTKLTFWENLVMIILLVPFMIFAVSNWGAVGGALTWVILNLLNVLVGMQIMHRILLRGELSKWYLEDVGLPALVVILFVGICRYFYPNELSRELNFILLLLMSFFAITISLFTTPFPRKRFLEEISKTFKKSLA
jgi:O-antigen/teichoic acid export membrane protein